MKQQLPPDVLKKCIFLAGPTAVGKTDVTIEVHSRKPNIEILSLDSMCVYRGMDIGTAKPDAELRAKIPHHLIDLVEPHEDFSVVDYIARARGAAEDTLARGNQPVFVGGTGMYLRCILRGVFEGPPANEEIRNRLQKQAEEAEAKGDNYWLMRQLERVDVDAALRLHPNDKRRLIRAIEVYELTGKPLTEQQKQPPLTDEEKPPHVYWLSPPREWLYDRINRRVELMIEAGLIAEVRQLLALPEKVSHTARQGLGYKEVFDVLSDDSEAELSEEQLAAVVDTIQTRTRQFAKRQHTWFRNLDECSEIEMTEDDSPATIADRVVSLFDT
jgi:tRNA dimethylallyltransferase